jgi:outer membrane protein TolC
VRARAAVALAYWQLAYEERRVAAHEHTVELATRREEAGRRRLAAGDIGEGEYTLLSADLVGARSELRRAEADRDAARARLNVLIGRPPAEGATTAGEQAKLPPAAPLESLLVRARERRPDLAAANQELVAREADVALVGRERLPNPVLGVGYAFESASFAADDIDPPGALDGISDRDQFLGLTLAAGARAEAGRRAWSRSPTERYSISRRTGPRATTWSHSCATSRAT